MKYSQNRLLHGTVEEGTELLYEAGLNLSGKPLRRSSWQEIAQAILNQGRIATVLLMRLRVAHNREDALRVLRMARKQKTRQQRGSSGKGRPQREPGQILLQRQTQQATEESYDAGPYWDDMGWYPGQGEYEDFLAWQAMQDGHLSDSLPHPPLSPVQEIGLHLAWQRRQQPGDTSVRAAISEETYRQLLSISGAREVILSQEEENFFSAHELHHLLEQNRALPVIDGYGLAGLDILQAYGVATDTYTVRWIAVSHWFGQRMQQEPNEDLPWLVASLHYFVYHSPTEALRLLLGRFCQDNFLHQAWLPLLPYFLQRLPELLPGLQGKGLTADFPTNWEQMQLDIIGSTLPLVLMRDNLADLLEEALPVSEHGRQALLPLLISGGGTLRGQAYPSFTLTARPVLSLVGPQTVRGMLELAQALYQGSWGVRTQPTNAVTELLRLALNQAGTPPLRWDDLWLPLVEHAIGYVMLVEEVYPGAEFRIRRKHVRRFGEQHANGELVIATHLPRNLEATASRYGVDRLIEGLVHAFLSLFNERWPGRDGQELSLKEPFIQSLRTLALHYHSGLTDPQPPHLDPYNTAPESVRNLADLLVRQSLHAPLELAQALSIDHEQGFPLLAGGRMTDWEHRTRHLLRDAAGGVIRQDVSQPPRIFTCRPLSKAAALERGDLGGDCSSQAVPLRATSPHHTYYGIWENGQQQRGYMTVFECWAEDEEGVRLPALCLETINVPIAIFDAVQQDLLLIFDAVAASRGLHAPIAMTTGAGTWNYQNGTILRHSRRFRQGEEVVLAPADPVQWQVYGRISREEGFYSSFDRYRGSGLIRILAPFDPAQDVVQPENLAEAERLAALSAHRLKVTMRDHGVVAGFSSSWPVRFVSQGDTP